MPSSNQDVRAWEVRPGGFVGSKSERRDFEVLKPGRATRFIVALSWNERQPQQELEERCAGLILRMMREIAAQETLPIRR
jgi:hypothetical protein